MIKSIAPGAILLALAASSIVTAQEYRKARPYPGVNQPVVMPPAPAPAPAPAPTTQPAPSRSIPEVRGPAANPANWEIGPIIRGRNYSKGMPLRPSEVRQGTQGAWSFDFPGPRKSDGHVHYVTMPVQSLQGARRVSMTYRIDAAPGVQFRPQEQPDTRATMSVYFQVRGDNWSARDAYRTARWYAPNEKIMPVTPGTHTVSIGMDENWAAVTAFKRETAPDAFRSALANAHRVGFVFGGGGGRGHGVFATGPARFTLIDFRVE